MTRSLIVMPAARLEIIEAQGWYEKEAIGLGALFRAEVDRQALRIIANPLAISADAGRHTPGAFATLSLRSVLSSIGRRDLFDCLLSFEPRSRHLAEPVVL